MPEDQAREITLEQWRPLSTRGKYGVCPILISLPQSCLLTWREDDIERKVASLHQLILNSEFTSFKVPEIILGKFIFFLN